MVVIFLFINWALEFVKIINLNFPSKKPLFLKRFLFYYHYKLLKLRKKAMKHVLNLLLIFIMFTSCCEMYSDKPAEYIKTTSSTISLPNCPENTKFDMIAIKFTDGRTKDTIDKRDTKYCN